MPMTPPQYEYFFGLILLLLSSVNNANGKSCQEIGFTPNMVSCSKCEELHDFTKDEDIFNECKKCCTEENNESNIKKYIRATLLVCS